MEEEYFEYDAMLSTSGLFSFRVSRHTSTESNLGNPLLVRQKATNYTFVKIMDSLICYVHALPDGSRDYDLARQLMNDALQHTFIDDYYKLLDIEEEFDEHDHHLHIASLTKFDRSRIKAGRVMRSIWWHLLRII